MKLRPTQWVEGKQELGNMSAWIARLDVAVKVNALPRQKKASDYMIELMLPHERSRTLPIINFIHISSLAFKQKKGRKTSVDAWNIVVLIFF